MTTSPPPPPPPMPPPPMGYPAPEPSSLGHCPSCGTEIKFCASCGAPLAQHPGGHPPTAPQPGVATGTSLFDVVLHDPGRKKIQVIKELREMTGLGLKEAKDLVDLADERPTIVVAGVREGDAHSMAATLAAAGGTASAEPHTG